MKNVDFIWVETYSFGSKYKHRRDFTHNKIRLYRILQTWHYLL